MSDSRNRPSFNLKLSPDHAYILIGVINVSVHSTFKWNTPLQCIFWPDAEAGRWACVGVQCSLWAGGQGQGGRQGIPAAQEFRYFVLGPLYLCTTAPRGSNPCCLCAFAFVWAQGSEVTQVAVGNLAPLKTTGLGGPGLRRCESRLCLAMLIVSFL